MRDKCTFENVENELNEIIDLLKSSEIDSLNNVAKTYMHWRQKICNSFLTYGQYNKKTSNGFIEGKKRLIKEIKAFSCGFNNFSIYRARILYISSKNGLAFRKDDGQRKKFGKQKRGGNK